MTRLTTDCGGITVSYTDDLDGGGQDFGKQYLPFVRDQFPDAAAVLEWCSGPGFIGFSLLGHGLCESLALADINPDAISACDDTITRNNLANTATAYLSDCFESIPAHRAWDLIVGNPPHVNTTPPGETEFQRHKPQVIYLDQDWAIHRRFYAQARRHLAPGGSVVLQEKYRFARPEVFFPMIESGGLRVHEVVTCPPPHEEYYFLWSRPAA